MVKPSRWDAAGKAEAERLWRTTETTAEDIGKRYGVSRSAILGHMRRKGYSRGRYTKAGAKHKAVEVENEAEFRAAWADPGLTIDQAAAKLGLTRDAARNRAEKLGIRKARTYHKGIKRPSTPQPRPKPPKSEEEGGKLGLEALSLRTCRWPFGNIPPFRFCGEETVAEGKSYCAHHHWRAHNGLSQTGLAA